MRVRYSRHVRRQWDVKSMAARNPGHQNVLTGCQHLLARTIRPTRKMSFRCGALSSLGWLYSKGKGVSIEISNGVAKNSYTVNTSTKYAKVK